MRYPWANSILLILLVIQLVTGFGGLISGATTFGSRRFLCDRICH